jgi:hypothetical protein
MSGERDKLRADIMDANQRASLLAQEVDDHHARLEKSSQLQVRWVKYSGMFPVDLVHDSGCMLVCAEYGYLKGLTNTNS